MTAVCLFLSNAMPLIPSACAGQDQLASFFCSYFLFLFVFLMLVALGLSFVPVFFFFFLILVYTVIFHYGLNVHFFNLIRLAIMFIYMFIDLVDFLL